MQSLRTPDERFVGLPDFPFAPRYVDIDDGEGGSLRIHYLDEGPTDAPPVLLMHGEPSWCFLYRTMIPVLTAAGHRVIAPDLVGFGRSDKPAKRTDYTYQRHVDWMRRALVETLDVRDATFVGQDWGGLIGLRLVAEHPDRFSRVVAANTMLPDGSHDPGEAFLAWQKYSQETPTFHVGGIVKGGSKSEMTPEVVAAYDAPFPDESFKEGARQFPLLVPTSPDDPAAPANRAAWDVFRDWKKPFLTAFSDSDAITRGGERVFQSVVPGAAGRDHPTIVGGGHFLQEDCGPELARVVAEFIAAT
jgi:haloalkane dehalogenase